MLITYIYSQCPTQDYKEKLTELFDKDSGHWLNNYFSPQTQSLTEEFWGVQYRFLAREAVDSGYPLDLGTFEKLNERGEALVSFNVIGEHFRYGMDKDSPDAEWRTFRDGDPAGCYSIFTGTPSVALKGRWLDLESCNKQDIVEQQSVRTMERKKPRTRIVNHFESIVSATETARE